MRLILFVNRVNKKMSVKLLRIKSVSLFRLNDSQRLKIFKTSKSMGFELEKLMLI